MRRIFMGLSAILLLGMAFAVSQATFAQTTATWTTNQYALGAGHVTYSSPTIADIDGDGRDEILVGTTRQRCDNNGCTFTQVPKLIVMNADGTIKWSRQVESNINSAPSVADIDGDGDMEIVVSFGGETLNPVGNGGVRAYDHLGNVLWTFYTYDVYDPKGYTDGVFSTPALCDVDGDGDMEIAFGAWDQRIYLLDHNGNSLWNNLHWSWTDSGRGYINADTVWSSPACADFDTDGNMEIIIGADISSGGILPDGTPGFDGGFLYVFDRFGNVLARRDMPETIFSSPAIGDIDNDGALEIVVGTGWYWWDRRGRTETRYVYAFETTNLFNTSLAYSDPRRLPYAAGWPQPTAYPGFSSPALADLDGDQDLEIIIGAGDPFLNDGDIPGEGAIYVWHHTGDLMPGWPVFPKNANDPPQDGPIRSSPTVADVDNDGQLEILFSHLWDVQIYDIYGQREKILQTLYTVEGSPAVGDTDGDNRVEVWIGGSDYYDQSQGYLWKFETDVVGVGARPWPMFHRNASHGGFSARPPKLVVPVVQVMVMSESPTVVEAAMVLENEGDDPLDWSIASVPPNVTPAATSGRIPPHRSESVPLQVDLTGLTQGTHTLGQISFTALNAPSTPSVNVTVLAYIGPLSYSYLPVVVDSK